MQPAFIICRNIRFECGRLSIFRKDINRRARIIRIDIYYLEVIQQNGKAFVKGLISIADLTIVLFETSGRRKCIAAAVSSVYHFTHHIGPHISDLIHRIRIYGQCHLLRAILRVTGYLNSLIIITFDFQRLELHRLKMDRKCRGITIIFLRLEIVCSAFFKFILETEVIVAAALIVRA